MSAASGEKVAASSLPAEPPLPLAQLLPVVVIWLVLALLPVGRMSELPMLVGVVTALVLLVRQPGTALNLPAVRLALLLFACYWLPALASALDAVDPGKTWGQVASQLRFGLFSIFVAATLRSVGQWRWLLRASALLVALWLIDAWVQALTGTSLGGSLDSDRLSGIFGADNLKLGGVLAALSPLLLVWMQSRFGLKGVLVSALALSGVILLAGSRAAWLVWLLVLVGWCWRPGAIDRRRALAVVGAVILAGLAVGYGAYQWSPEFAQRIERTVHLARGDAAGVDHALAGRLNIWQASVEMVRAHPVNGVGVRGFRQVYADYAVDGDWLLDQGGAFHAHQLVLEVATETGAIGVLGWLAGLVIVWRTARRLPAAARWQARPVLLALAAMCFPLNTHYAFYSSWWGLFFWWLLAVAVAVLHVRDEHPNPGAPGR
ncbi:MAG: O-antigen ligase family protein [Xanthomonadales bacterium]|nr:O-antigen ligase family protein [Xanthomonadales bacterium]